MYHKPTTLTEFFVAEEKKHKSATGNLTMLLLHIESAAKIIHAHVRQAGLVDIIGETGKVNASQDAVKKVDVFANDLLITTLQNSGLVSILGSEELDETIIVDKKAPYNVFFDPMDGSGNIDNALPVGTIFSIYKNIGTTLQPGNKQIASGYILYGASTLFVYSTGTGVHGFTFDPAIGSFLLSHENVKMPKKGSIYAVNEGYSLFWDEKTKHAIDNFKKTDYKLRWLGAAVADIHRTLISGGIFLFPKDAKHTTGKLRLMYEINPLAFLLEQAGGKAISDNKNPLDIKPSSVHQKIPIAMGSIEDVQTFLIHSS